MTRLFARQEAARPFLIIGVVGALLALVSFFWVPIRDTFSAWNLWQQSVEQSQGSGIALLLVTAFLVCAGVTLLIGCAALFRPLPRLAAHGYTLAMLVGLGAFVVSLCATFPFFVFNWASLGMGVGYFCILIGHYAFKAE